MGSRGRGRDPAGVTRAMTVAHLRARPGALFAEVLFLDSARVYRLPITHPDFDRLVARLRQAIAARHAVRVRLAAPDSDVILDVNE